jgi:hypothetical protein
MEHVDPQQPGFDLAECRARIQGLSPGHRNSIVNQILRVVQEIVDVGFGHQTPNDQVAITAESSILVNRNFIALHLEPRVIVGDSAHDQSNYDRIKPIVFRKNRENCLDNQTSSRNDWN